MEASVTTAPDRSRLRQQLLSRALRPSRCSPRELAVYSALMAVIGLGAFGAHVLNGGFYNDDWAHSLSYRYAEPGVFGAIDAFDWQSFRPGAMLYWPFMHAAFGLDFELHLAWVLLMGIAMSVALYLLLRRLGMESLHAGVIAALVLIFPFSDANRLWAAASIALPAMTLYLLGTLVALQGLAANDRRHIALHAAAVALYVASVMTYEIAAGAILCSLLLYRWRGRWGTALPRWLVDVVAVGCVLLFVTSGSWNERRGLEAAVSHAREIADESVSLLASAALPFGPRRTELVIALLVAVLVVGLAGCFTRWMRRPVRRELRRWLLTALAGAIAVGAGYLSFVPADAAVYAPLHPGQHNRVNGLAAIGFVIVVYSLAMVAGILIAGRLRRWRRLSAAVALSAAALIGLGYVQEVERDRADWDRSAELQTEIVAQIKRALPHPPPDATIYAVRHATEAAPGVPVFAALWDLSGALQTTWNDPTLAAYPGVPGTTFACGPKTMAARNWNDQYGSQTAGYEKTFLVDVASARAFRITDRATCRSLAVRFTS